jgi:hypothetical protein
MLLPVNKDLTNMTILPQNVVLPAIMNNNRATYDNRSNIHNLQRGQRWVKRKSVRKFKPILAGEPILEEQQNKET